MSQHYLKFFHEPSACEVRVQLGWDRPLRGFYMVALKDQEDLPDDDDEVVYSNLNDVGHPSTLSHFRDVSEQLGFPIPDSMWRAAYNDSQLNIVNKQSYYDVSGDLVDPF